MDREKIAMYDRRYESRVAALVSCAGRELEDVAATEEFALTQERRALLARMSAAQLERVARAEKLRISEA